MPIGILVNTSCIIIGGLIGTIAGKYISEGFKNKINMVFGCCSFAMGMSTCVLMKNMPVIIFSLIAGTIIGTVTKLGYLIHKGGEYMQKLVSKIIKVRDTSIGEKKTQNMNILVTLIILFCFSATGVYGSMVSGITGDHSLLLSKSILDIFTAAFFAADLGLVVSLIAVPQTIVFFTLFLCSSYIFPLISEHMLDDFKACGGTILFATGFLMLDIKRFPIPDMIPSLIIVMPISYLCETYILPLIVA